MVYYAYVRISVTRFCEEAANMNEQTVGQRIAALRAAQGLTQAQLGEQLGVSGKAVSKWEVGVSQS